MQREESVTPSKGKGSLPDFTLQALLKSIQEAQDLESIKRTLSKHILDIFQVEMAAIFLVNTSKEELDSWLLIPGDSLEKIVVPIGTGSIVGFVATKKKAVNLGDPYDFQQLRRGGSELSFSDEYDVMANIRSKQILAIPIVDDNTLMGVVELINKRDDTPFSIKEKNKVNELAQGLAGAFLKHNLFDQQIPAKYEYLLAQKLLSRKELIQGLAKATELGEDPDTVLMKDFHIPRLKMGKLLAEFYSTTFTDLEKVDSNPKKLFPGLDIGYFEKEELVPLSLNNGKLVVAVKNIDDQSLASTIRKQVPKVNQVELVFAFQEDIRSFWKRIKKAEGTNKRPDEKIKKVVDKYNLNEAEDLLGSLLSEESQENDEDLFFDDLLYDEDDYGDALGDEHTFATVDDRVDVDEYSPREKYQEEAGFEQVTGEIEPVSAETEVCAAILIHAGGVEQEASQVKLFVPKSNTLVILDEETSDEQEQVVFLDQLTCLRVSSLPAKIPVAQGEPSTKEIIETIDGNTYNVLVSSRQSSDSLLVCSSTDIQSPFPVILFPKLNIKKRTLDKRLVDILLEKRYVSKIILQKAIQDFEQVKKMTFEKILAEKSRVPLAKIEEILDQAKHGPMQGMQKEEILLFSGLITEGDILDAVEYREYLKKLKIGQFLVERKIASEKEVYISLAEKHKIPFLDLRGRKISKKSFASLPKDMILKHEMIPLALKHDTLVVATHYVDLTHLTEEILKAADCTDVRFALSLPSQIKNIINWYSLK